jgi:hypothetical protein
MLVFDQNLARTGKLSLARFEISTFVSASQSLFTYCFALILPVFPLTLTARAYFVAEPLSRALNLEESPALSIGADTNIARIKKFPPENAVKQGPNSKADVGVHF